MSFSKKFFSIEEAEKLSIDEVKGVFLGSDFITITKEENSDWQILKTMVLGAPGLQAGSGDGLKP